jgi:hypothetical protein
MSFCDARGARVPDSRLQRMGCCTLRAGRDAAAVLSILNGRERLPYASGSIPVS